MNTLKIYLFVFIIAIGIFGLVYPKNQPKNYLKTFPWFLIAVGVLDGVGLLINTFLKAGYPKLNFYYYQIFVIPLQFIYYFWIINKNIVTGKKLYYLSTIIYLISVIVELIVPLNFIKHFFSISFSIGNILLVVNILRYFYQLTQSDKILNFYKLQMFWISLGLLIFWLGSLPFYGLFNYLFKNFNTIFGFYYNIVLIFNYIMYTCFLIGFVWGAKEK